METKTFSSLAAAWAAVAGPHPLPEDLAAPAGRWTLSLEEVSASGDGPGISSSRVVRRAVISAGEAAAVPVVEDAPATLPESALFVVLLRGDVKGRASTRAGFDCDWLREVALGRVAAESGLALRANFEAALEVVFAGEFVAVLAREGPRVRLRVFKRNETDLLTAGVRVAAEAAAPLPEKPEDLVRVLLGVHDGQWIEALTGEYGAAIAKKVQVASAKLARALELWRGLDARAAAALWTALSDRPAFTEVCEWLHRIAGMPDRAAFSAAVSEAVESRPAFLRSQTAAWIEAVAGNLLAALGGDEAWRRVRAAAEQADAMFAEEGIARALGRIRRYAAEELGIAKLDAALSDPAAQVDEWLRARVAEALASSSAAAAAGAALAVARRVYADVATALARKLTAELAWRSGRSWRHEALVDCTFTPDEAGMELYRKALAGDAAALFDAALEGRVHAREAVLTHGIGGETRLALQLPFLDRSEWSSRWQALATARIEVGETGRMAVYTAEAHDRMQRRNMFQSALAWTGAFSRRDASFTLTYTDSRKLKRAEAGFQLEPVLAAYHFPSRALEFLKAAGAPEVEAALTISAPGDLAACWLRTPRENTAEYFRVWSGVSVAVQRSLRLWLPYVYFSDVRRYEDLNAAWPLLAYMCTRPFPGKPSSGFTYDIMDIGDMRVARQTVVRGLAAEMRRAEQLLLAAGLRGAAKFYRDVPPASVLGGIECQPANFNALIWADTVFVNALVDLGRRGREASDSLAAHPDRATRRLAEFAAEFAKVFHRGLRRLYGGESFPAFGALLFAEATRALSGTRMNLPAMLRLKAGESEQVFFNDGWRG
jgi:hypothetical protein